MKKIILTFLVIFLIPASIVLIQGCYPHNDITIAESDVVLTSFNDSVNFSSLKTYYMPDTVLPILDPTNPADFTNPFQAIMLSTVASNMAAYGYERITDTTIVTKPDVAVVISILTTTRTFIRGWYYPSWAWGFWGWYNPSFPPVPWFGSFTTGTVIISMYDRDIIGADTITTQYWSATSNGILQSGATAMGNRIEAAINQAFVQTPQIKTN
jgi:hypothetical protein